MCRALLVPLVVAMLSGWNGARQDRKPPDVTSEARKRMVAEQIQARGVREPRVLSVLRDVPRHLFLPPSLQAHAYDDAPLPIGGGQTISQPYIVALMTELVRPGADDRALEVGTGSGYQAAVLSRLVDRVFTIEILEPLAREAADRFKALGYSNVVTRVGDGYQGWPEQAPFDVIVVTAAADAVPPPLVQQLRPGGRLVIPIGPTWDIQDLRLLEKDVSGRVRSRSVAEVRFVPLVRK